MRSTVAATLVAAFGLSACEYVPFTPQSRIHEAQAQIAIHSDNPDSIRWSELKTGPEGTVCGIFNEERRTENYGTELAWTGPQHFVYAKGRTLIASNEEDCEANVRPWSMCVNDGDKAKADADVQACKVAQNESAIFYMQQAGLIPTGDAERDQTTLTASYRAMRLDGASRESDELSAVVDSNELFGRVYNARMRQVPENATLAQKIATAAEAQKEATRQSEAFLKERNIP